MVPLAFEVGGRPAQETIDYVRSYGHGLDDSQRSTIINNMWQSLSVLLQVGNGEMILSALGH